MTTHPGDRDDDGPATPADDEPAADADAPADERAEVAPARGTADAGHDETPGPDDDGSAAATPEEAPGGRPGVPTAVLDDAEVDRRFASILDQLGVGGGEPDGGSSAYRASALGTAPVERPVRTAPPRPEAPEPAPAPASGPRDHVVDEHPEDPAWGVDGFVEPDPPGPDLSDPGAIVGWLAALGPLVVGIVLGVVGEPPSVPLMLAGLAVTVAGVVLLVRRLPDERGSGSDGAVV